MSTVFVYFVVIGRRKKGDAMSHFPLWVSMPAGQDADALRALMQPFHEFECTGVDDQHVVDVDATEDLMADWEAAGRPNGSFGDYVLKEMGENSALHPGQPRSEAHKYSIVEFDSGGNVTRVVRRTNPNAKWDGWRIGGRWSESLIVKGGAAVTHALKRYIDIERMIDGERIRLGAKWDAVHSATAGQTWSPWRDYINGDLQGIAETIDARRAVYWSQPAVKAISNSGLDRPFEDGGIDEMLKPRQVYIDTWAPLQALPFAMLTHDGKWIERGNMGWFGQIDDDQGDAWCSVAVEAFRAIPDDHDVIVIDCHI